MTTAAPERNRKQSDVPIIHKQDVNFKDIEQMMLHGLLLETYFKSIIREGHYNCSFVRAGLNSAVFLNERYF